MNLCSKTVITALVVYSGFIIPVHGAERHVPDDYATIQAAVDAAESGDTIRISAGTFTGPGNRDISPLGKELLFTGAGPDQTIIDCGAVPGSPHRGFIIHSYEPTIEIAELSIENGMADDTLLFSSRGGAISCIASPLTLRNCRFTDCTALTELYNGESRGGAVAVDNSRLTIENCRFFNNAAQSGGALYCYGGTLLLQQSEFMQNTATGEYDSSGGAVCIYECPFILNACRFETNLSSLGGAVSSSSADGYLRDCVFTGNSDAVPDPPYSSGGAAIYLSYSTTTRIYNCLFEKNQLSSATGSRQGAAINNQGGDTSIQNCAFYANANTGTPGTGGAIYNRSECGIVNCVFRDNAAENGPAVAMFGYNCRTAIAFSNIQGGRDEVYLGDDECELGWGEGNIDLDPLFTDGPFGGYYLSQMDAGQPVDSPCVNSGLPSMVSLGSTRTDGATDTHRTDMGYHYLFPTLPEDIGLTCWVSHPSVSTGDDFAAAIHLENASYRTRELDLYAAIEIAGVYYFAPSFTPQPQFDTHFMDPGMVTLQILDWFEWPSGTGSGQAALYALVLENGTLVTDLVKAAFQWEDR